ncbi:hypothetical protein BSKO_10391 [Bryopsis sp. KO-2023]|nr:hypothetical protein BSKO_10391 [Bryopsis sp. KO-2023]
MGYDGAYTLLSRCVSECIATFMYIFLLETLLANKLLPKTKGHDLSYGFVATGIGFACFLAVQFLGEISTAVNPAMVLGNVIVGNYDVVDFFAIVTAETVGAFLGAVLVWVYYYPHFQTVPTPPPKKERERLLSPTNDLGRSSLMYASYSFKDSVRRKPTVRRYYNSRVKQVPLREEDILGHEAVLGRSGLTRRRSIAVGDLRRRVGGIGNWIRGRFSASPGWSSRSYPHEVLDIERPPPVPQVPHNDSDADLATRSLIKNASRQAINNHEATDAVFYAPCASFTGSMENQPVTCSAPPGGSGLLSEYENRPHPDWVGSPESTEPMLRGHVNEKEHQSARHTLPPVADSYTSLPDNKQAEEDDKRDALMDASIVANQNAKLAVFCTRPAEHLPLFNIIAEVVSTAFLVAGILFLNQRADMIYTGGREVYLHGIKSLYVGLLIIVLILSLGGPGIAMNPARDFGPRLAHFLLPIPGKGPSEWHYAWIPIVGPFIGGAVGAIAYLGINRLNRSDKDGGVYDERFIAVLKEMSEMVTRGVLRDGEYEIIKKALNTTDG